MRTQKTSLAVIAGFAVIFFSCNKDIDTSSVTPVTTYLDLPATPFNYGNGSDRVATLGRVLFYHTHLSVNNSVACASCHKQALAFSDQVTFSTGFQNILTRRNSLPIQNLRFGSFGPVSLFWDGREKFLSSMVLKPIVNHVEMGMNDLNGIVNQVKAMPYYAGLFQDAFGTTNIDINEIAEALSNFTGSITSTNTKFDQSRQGSVSLSALEEQGRSLFFTKYNCNSCHQTQQLNGYQAGGGEDGFVNIGLNVNYADNGLGEITHLEGDNGRFKIPNLRNVALTAPYMHDGRFATLDQVLNHYSHGIANHPNLDTRLKGSNNLPIQMNISDQEKGAIIAFLNTLTDFSMITDPKFSNPFRTR